MVSYTAALIILMFAPTSPVGAVLWSALHKTPPSLKTFCSIKISSVCHLEPVGSRYLWIGKIGLHITDD